ncbi:MAG TPA: transporter substrate-binding domain-containing protein [Propionicimonas sp.]|jgi:ABC-type amino acid transport substrate-binding protein|uniref:transporter substrate-binding domain-containing protein n=1 Tax=Propionicimonas sp. TaxID=1955623 RepID=UPI002F41CD70
MKRLISFAAAASALALVVSGCANYAQPSASSSSTASAPAAITDLSGLKGKTLAVQTDTTGQKYAEEHKAEFGYNIKVFDDLPGAVNAVLAGTADATINDNGVLYDFAKQNPTTKVVKEFNTGENYGFNVGKTNTGLLDVIDAALIEAKTDGTYKAIYQKWFGTDGPADVPTAPAASGAKPVLVDPTKLTVCTHLAYRPFQYLDTDNTTIIGFDVDLADVIAKKLGVTQKIVDIDFGQITSGAVFAAKKCDMGAAAITITPERDAAAPFSVGYFAATQALLVKP